MITGQRFEEGEDTNLYLPIEGEKHKVPLATFKLFESERIHKNFREEPGRTYTFQELRDILESEGVYITKSGLVRQFSHHIIRKYLKRYKELRVKDRNVKNKKYQIVRTTHMFLPRCDEIFKFFANQRRAEEEVKDEK